MRNYIDKYQIKEKGLQLEKTEPEKAIEFYNNLLTHEYFINDFWPYRRLVLMYKKTKEFDKKVEIIKKFFKSGIYCNNHHYLWFRNKLRLLADKDYITSGEIDLLTDYFKTHSIINKKKADDPLPIADRIIKRKGEIIVVSEDEYDIKQKQYEYDVRCTELNRQKRYDEYIELLNHMIDNLGYRRYGNFQKLCVAYRRNNDYDNELRIINKYMAGESTKTKVSDEWFEKRLKEVKGMEKSSESENEALKAEIENLKRENESLLKRIDKLENKLSYEISFNMDELNLTETPLYEYDSSLTELENLKRKNMLIQYAKSLTRQKQTDDAIKYFKYLCNNTYFSNDWYPYRQLTIIYDKTKDFNASLINIKKLFHSNIYLNRYQFIWFSEKIRKILEKENVDEKEVKPWFEYYETHGALNKDKSNKFLADKFIKINEDTIQIIDDEDFNHRQERYALEETGRVYERVGNYELAVTHYRKIITGDEFNYYQFYQRLCYCLEKLKDYENELKVIQSYYNNPPINVTESSDKWFEKRLKNVKNNLNNY